MILQREGWMNTTQAEQQLLLQANDPYKEQRFEIEEHRVNLLKNIVINIRLQDIVYLLTVSIQLPVIFSSSGKPIVSIT
jgi:hypothetical protein